MIVGNWTVKLFNSKSRCQQVNLTQECKFLNPMKYHPKEEGKRRRCITLVSQLVNTTLLIFQNNLRNQ